MKLGIISALLFEFIHVVAKTFAATFLNLDFLCLQHVSKINARNIFQQIVSEFPESPTIGESEIF